MLIPTTAVGLFGYFMSYFLTTVRRRKRSILQHGFQEIVARKLYSVKVLLENRSISIYMDKKGHAASCIVSDTP